MAKTVAEALEPVKQHYKDTKEHIDWSKGAAYDSRTGHRTVNLRLDWERVVNPLNDESDLQETDETFDIMFSVLQVDLEDLIENGDTSRTKDPLLKMLDGYRKRGVPPVDIEISKAHLSREVKPKKNAIEYTLHFVLYVKWPGGSSGQMMTRG